MPRQVIFKMDQHYPFGQYQQSTTADTKVLVRKIYPLTPNSSPKIMQKISLLRRIKNQNLIKIQSLLEEEDSIHFLYEYVPIKLQTWISNINDQFIKNFRDQLIKLSVVMANHGLQTNFQLGKIGMDQNYNAKYFLDLSFDIVEVTYLRDITNLFRPHVALGTYNAPQPDRNTNETIRKPRGGELAISPPTNRHKWQALQKYYQEANMSVDSANEKILQEFMDVLDGEEPEQSGDNSASQGNITQLKKQDTQLTVNHQKQNQSLGEGRSKTLSQQQDSKLRHQKMPQVTKPEPARTQRINLVQTPQNNRFSLNQRPRPNQNSQQQNVNLTNSEQQIPKFTKNPKKFTSMSNIKDIESVHGSLIAAPLSWSLPSNLHNRVKMVIQKGRLAINSFNSIKPVFK